MVTGRRMYERATDAETIAAIVQVDPPRASTVNAAVPPLLDRIIQHCIEESPSARFQSGSDLAFALSTVTTTGSQAAPGLRVRSIRSTLSQTVAVAMVGAIGGALIAGYATGGLQQRSPARARHFTFDMHATPVSESTLPLALSPDGTKLVVSVSSYQGTQLYLRSFDRPDFLPIPGTPRRVQCSQSDA